MLFIKRKLLFDYHLILTVSQFKQLFTFSGDSFSSITAGGCSILTEIKSVCLVSLSCSIALWCALANSSLASHPLIQLRVGERKR